MAKWFEHPETKQMSPFPWGLEQAKKLRRGRYTCAEPCERCGSKTPDRYTLSGACQNCVMIDLTRLQQAYNGKAEMPADMVLQIYEPKPWNIFRRPCTKGPHFQDLDPASGLCRNCDIERAQLSAPTGREQIEQNLGADLTRDQARHAGFTLYNDHAQCLRGHPGWRYVSTGQCWFCARGAEGEAPATAPQARPGRPLSPEAQMALDNPDMLLSRADARALGMGLFRTGEPCKYGHTGWRRVDSGACLDCLRNRNT